MSEGNRGIKQMEAMIERQKRDLRKLIEEKTQLEAKYRNTKTSNLERARVEMRVRQLLLPQIIRLQKTILSQSKMANAFKKKFKTIQTLKNRKEKQNARVAMMMPPAAAAKALNKPGFFQGLFTRKAAKAAGQGSHLSANERKELNELEAELVGSMAAYAPSTTTTTSTVNTNTNAAAANFRRRLNALKAPARVNNNLEDFEAELMASNEWKAMEAKNAIKEQLERNMREAKTEEQRTYYKNMLRGIENANTLNNVDGTENLNAMLSQLEGIGAGAGSGSGVKEPTAEELRELEEYLAHLGGGKRKASRRRMTRRMTRGTR
jgi:hypothetical protein